jgi:hypothetical protein
MKLNIPLLLIISAWVIGCTHKDHITSPVIGATDLRDYIPVKAGNAWTYSASSQYTNGAIDTTLSSSLDISVFQTNALIGGQPNAFVIGTSDGVGQVRHLAFYLDQTTLWHYLGGSVTIPGQTNSIPWVPGGVGGAVIGVRQAQTYHVTDQAIKDNAFSIQRPSDPNIALAKMISQDTVQITGVSEGLTTFCLHQVGGEAADTMTVLVESTRNPSPSIPFLRPWFPLWQLTNSPSDQIVFSWDTTYSFRRLSDSSLCRDDFHYLVTNRRVGEDLISAMNTSLMCDKFEMQLINTETVSYTDRFESRVMFQGPSTSFVVEMWLAKGIGFVKGTIDGASRFPGVTMAGNKDSNGVLQGFYLSPRVRYAGAVDVSTSPGDYFQVDDTPLGPNTTTQSFILNKKSF